MQALDKATEAAAGENEVLQAAEETQSRLQGLDHGERVSGTSAGGWVEIMTGVC